MGNPAHDHQAGDDTSVWWRSRWLSAIYDSDLSPTQRFVASVYADFAGEGRTSWSAISTVMHRTGYSKASVVRARNALTETGWLVPVAKSTRHKAATYALVMPGVSDVHPSTDLGVSERDTRGLTVTPPGVSERDTSNPLEKNHQSSLSPNQEALRKALDCSPQDERLMIADSLFAAHNVRFAPAWLRTAKSNGSLDNLIAEQQRSTKADSYWRSSWKDPSQTTGNDGDNSWSAKRTDPAEFWQRLVDLAGSESEAEKRARHEADGFGFDLDHRHPMAVTAAIRAYEIEQAS